MKLLNYENRLWKKGYNFIAGIDESGRGPLAGPVVAAAVIFPKYFNIPEVNDSKKLTAFKRETLYDQIISNCLTFGIGVIDVSTIDEINILNATFKAMHIAIDNLTIEPDYILIDGNRFKSNGIAFRTIIKGDEKSFTIASASILAKVTRDRIMFDYDRYFSEYNFSKHKGYGTKEHIEIIRRIGVSGIHRKSFKVKSLYK
jgi:ribonuclease HII